MKIVIGLSAIILALLSCGDKKTDKQDEYIANAKQELTLLNQQYDSALLAADTIRLGQLYAPEFSYTTPEGQVRSRAEQLSNLATGGLNLEFGESDEVETMVYDSTGIVTGRFIGKGVFKENIIEIKERYTTVWIRKAGAWKLVKEHGTFIK